MLLCSSNGRCAAPGRHWHGSVPRSSSGSSRKPAEVCLETGVTGNRRITCSRAPHGESRRAATAATQQVGVHVGLGVSGPPPRAQGSAQRPAAPGRCRRRRGTGQVRRARQSVRNVGEGACGAGTFHSRLAPMRWEKPVTTSGLLSSGSHCRSPGFCTPDIFCPHLEAVPCGWKNRKHSEHGPTRKKTL